MGKRNRRIIAVVTGSRADFSLLRPVMHAVDQHPALELRVIVTGVHLMFGTDRDVTDAGLTIHERVPMQNGRDIGRDADVAALGYGIVGLGAALATLKPQIVLVLGDRIEAMAAACAAQVGGIHLAHIHGGDRAEGVADEAMRHAITKLAHIHLPATAASRRRIIRMGEDPAAVFRTGSPAVDGLRSVSPADDAPQLLVVQHPIGASDAEEHEHMAGTLRATADHRRLVMMPNGDPGRDGIAAAIAEARVAAVDHLPHARFRRVLAGAQAIVGNSSTGLIEAAALRVPAVNVGPREAGREKPANVIDCDYGEAAVRAAIKKALQLDLRRMRHPYGNGQASEKIADLLASVDLSALPLRKRNTY